MKNFAAVGLMAVSALIFSACSGNGGTSAVPSAGSGKTTQSATASTGSSDVSRLLASGAISAACPSGGAGTAQCLSYVVNDNSILDPSVTVAPAPAGYGPADLQSAYNTASLIGNGSGNTIAIVDAFFDPYAYRELTAYRNQFGLPACTLGTTPDSCFRWVDQNGNPLSQNATTHPKIDSGWALETALDLDMVSAGCPKCNIVLVETNDNYNYNLGAGVDQAAKMGVLAISNSYGGSEGSGETGPSYSGHYNHPGIAITASTGDGGYGAMIPAALNTVVAVGGTTLKRSGTARGWTEAAWSGAGSGCSAYVSKPAWQHDAGCPRRTVADVSSDSDTKTGVAVYSVYYGGFIVVGGTSAASPFVASLYGLAGSVPSQYPGQQFYTNASSLFDVTGGANGSCYPLYLCHGVVGYDGPTGNGTPNGIGAF